MELETQLIYATMFTVTDSYGEPLKWGFRTEREALNFLIFMGRMDWKVTR